MIWDLAIGRQEAGEILDIRGKAVSHGQIYVFQHKPGFVPVPQTTYADAECTIANCHPIILDQNGRAPHIYIEDVEIVDVTLRDSDGEILATITNVCAPDIRAVARSDQNKKPASD